ncbi:Receptor-like protein 12 [Vitis vinifera]|uniref:Receptor-like protein 12 n=1 Tax=Vitis vinifera TaxID=29760 RepID=A0A438DKN4_VITVI|nr:Receptor-like protein 12 [Vitis vinifera]
MLDLSSNSLSGIIPSSIRLMPHLKSLSLAGNHLNGSLQNQGFCQLNKLQELDLSYNLFQGILPPCLNNFTSLRLLDLSSNLFSGNLSSPMLPNLTSLEYIDLSSNQFEGSFSFSSFANHSKLQVVILGRDNNNFEVVGRNNNKFEVETEYPVGWVPLFQLKALSLSSCKLTGDLPGFLQYQFRSNSKRIGNMTDLTTLVLGNNSFKGKLPPEISQLQQMEFLDVSQNALSGSLPSLKSMKSLKHLYLQGNMFTGLIPRDFLNSSNLLTLDIRENRLFGSIPNSIFALLKLRILLLGGNLLSGFIPNHLCHLTEISLMDLSNNYFSGPIPRCFGHIRFGEMKKEDNVFGQSMEFSPIDDSLVYAGYLEKYWWYLSPIYNETDEVEFVTKNRRYSYKGGILEFMSGLDLSCNNLTGEIPHELGMLSWIRALNLSHNQLNGSIPKSLSNLSQIESLDLSYNKLGGEIPLELVELNFLAVFSVAYNNISGRVPDTKAQFGTFDESSYEEDRKKWDV